MNGMSLKIREMGNGMLRRILQILIKMESGMEKIRFMMKVLIP